MGGQVPFTFDQLTAGAALAKAGKLKLLAVTTPKRTPLAPDTPTMIEAGVKGFEMVSWQAVYAPKGTPQPIVATAERRDRQGPQDAGRPRQADRARWAWRSSAARRQELTALMQREIPRWAELVKKSGATPN